MNEKLDIGARVRRTRRGLDLTQETLAARIGIAHSTLVRIERGKTRPNVDTLFKLAEVLGVDPKWILDGEDHGWMSPAEKARERGDEG